MICNFSDPVNYLGDEPVSTLEAFNFSTVECETPTATASASLDYEFFTGYFQTFIFALSMIVFICFFFLGIQYAKR